MKFRTELKVASGLKPIHPSEKLLFLGSCFSSEIGGQMARLGIPVTINPFGVIFHPFPLLEILKSAVQSDYSYTEEHLYEHESRFFSLGHHGSFSGEDKDELLNELNIRLVQLRNSLSSASVICLTLGTSYGYEFKGRVVANCHKLPQRLFEKQMTSSGETQIELEEVISSLHRINKDLQVVLTVSPVRHIKDGIVENTLSKAKLLTAVHGAVSKLDKAYYFPSYELIMDDLRDYRFFKSDLIHPNEMAVRYVFEKFKKDLYPRENDELFHQLEKLYKLKEHRPSYQGMIRHEEQISRLEAQLFSAYPWLENRV